MTEADDEQPQAGTARPARTRKAACGIRFEEDELQEGVDFSGAVELKPEETAEDRSVGDKKRQQDGDR